MRNKFLAALIITLLIELVFYVIGKFSGLFQVYCKLGSICPSEEKIFFQYFLYSIVPLYIVVLVVYFIFKRLKK